MSITSFTFILFIFATLILYYLVPKKFQWVVLLAASTVFYAFSGLINIVYVLLTSIIAYISTLLLKRKTDYQKDYLKNHKSELSKDEKKEFKEKTKLSRKKILIVSVLIYVANLVILKIFNPSSFLINLFPNGLSLIIPLGISYYTLQTIGYIVDVYWNISNAETNYFKLLLYISFFPQIIQGPINDYKQLSAQFYNKHCLLYENFIKGFERALWGYFKKIVIADSLTPYIEDLFKNYSSYSSITLLIGVCACMIRLYVDFSGYMDIVCGIAEMFDIKLTENFNRPFFSKSLSEFWTRWHISLGSWFKKYVFYTVAFSNWNNEISNKVSKYLSKNVSEKIVSSIALISVWFLIGFWHGASAAYIIWGLTNGAIMIISDLLEPTYCRIKNHFRIRDKSFIWKSIQIVRTFAIVSFLEILTDVGSVRNGIGYIVRSLSFISLKSKYDLLPYFDFNHINSVKSAISAIIDCTDKAHPVFVIIFGLFCILIISFLGRNQKFSERFFRLPLLLRVTITAVLFVFVILYGTEASINNAGGFLYAEF